MQNLNIPLEKFILAFFGVGETVCIRVFDDKKLGAFKGQKLECAAHKISNLADTLKKHNAQNRGIFFVINYGGHGDADIKRINAQFVECDDLSFDEQLKQIEDFPLPPSIIVKTQKSLHTYWLINEGNVSEFRKIQKGLVVQFHGDKACINESRVLRVPGFNHCKGEPVMVECIKFNPELRYTQVELEAVLPKIREDASAPKSVDCTDFEKPPVGNAARVITKCAFMEHCKNNAAILPEPHWHAMISNISLTSDGKTAVHELSKPYSKYNAAETEEKINRAISQHKPHTCKYVHDTLGFDCGQKCEVKAPVVYAVIIKDEQLDEFLDKPDLTAEDIFSEDSMVLLHYAKEHQPCKYILFKQRLKKLNISVRDFEAVVKSVGRDIAPKRNKETFTLTGIDLNGAVGPENWAVTMKRGVEKITFIADGVTITTICLSPIVIVRRLENLDNESEKIELAFYRNGRWKHILAPRSQVFNKNSIIKFADNGLPVSSDTSGDVVKYLCDYEMANIDKIPFVRSIGRIGWLKNEFFPYATEAPILFETEYNEGDGIYSGLKKHGDLDTWRETAIELRKNEFARFLLSASFASPLIERLGHRVFFVHIWHDSQSGKTAAIKFALSVWGNPHKLLGSFNSTLVGLERMAGTLKHLPFGIDELQVLNEKRMTVESVVYSMGFGEGKVRGAKDGGLQDKTDWRNILITSGEQPMSKDSSNDGVTTRVLEVYGKPTASREFGQMLHQICEENYCLVGQMYIRYVISCVLSKRGKLKADYKRILDAIKKNAEVSAHAANIAVVCLGDYYASMSVFELDEQSAFDEAVKLGLAISANSKSLEKEDTISRAYNFIENWVIENRGRFVADSTPCYGAIEGNKVYINPKVLYEALQSAEFDYSKITKGLKDRGKFETQKTSDGHYRMQVQKRINGVSVKMFVIRMDLGAEDIEPLQGKNSDA